MVVHELAISYLIARTDGVGTKLKLTFVIGIHDTIGIGLILETY